VKRRDLLDASKLLRRHKMDPSDMAALGLATEYLSEKKEEKTVLGFQAWLDEEVEDEDDDLDEDAESADADDEAGPTKK
jgi:hypothetical protein